MIYAAILVGLVRQIQDTWTVGDALIDVAEQVNADLLVVGNRGMSGVRRMLGSVPNKVSHHCPCTLLIVDTTAQ